MHCRRSGVVLSSLWHFGQIPNWQGFLVVASCERLWCVPECWLPALRASRAHWRALPPSSAYDPCFFACFHPRLAPFPALLPSLCPTALLPQPPPFLRLPSLCRLSRLRSAMGATLGARHVPRLEFRHDHLTSQQAEVRPPCPAPPSVGLVTWFSQLVGPEVSSAHAVAWALEVGKLAEK